MKRLVSGIKPTGELHIGNYIGAIAQYIELQKEYDSFFFIADYHSLTTQPRPEELTENTLHVAAMLLACGVDPKYATLFVQSAVPEHAELSLIMNNFTSMGQLRRMVQFKEKSSQHGENAGLFTYPVLMTADVAIYDAEIVPVGDDQIQHLELSREIIRSINHHSKTNLFKEPKPLLSHAPRIMSLSNRYGHLIDPDNPPPKMSKSISGGAIGLLDDEATIIRNIRKAVTDTPAIIDPNSPTMSLPIRNLFAILKTVSKHKTYLEFENKHRNGKLQYGELKEQLIEDTLDFLKPIQKTYKSIRRDEAGLKNILEEGNKKAQTEAKSKLVEVKKALGLLG